MLGINTENLVLKLNLIDHWVITFARTVRNLYIRLEKLFAIAQLVTACLSVIYESITIIIVILLLMKN